MPPSPSAWVVVRDGRGLAFGFLFLGVGSGIAGLMAAVSGSVLIGIGAALAGALFLAQARLEAARRAFAPPAADYNRSFQKQLFDVSSFEFTVL